MMTAITVERDEQADTPHFRAVAGDKEACGKTIGEAIDAIMPQLDPYDNALTLITVPSFRPDRFFTAEQQQRLAELMERFRTARDAGTTMPAEEHAELEQLVSAEIRASGQRVAAAYGGTAKPF